MKNLYFTFRLYLNLFFRLSRRTAYSSSSHRSSYSSIPESVMFYLNGEKRIISDVDPSKTLLDYLREGELLTGERFRIQSLSFPSLFFFIRLIPFRFKAYMR
jgi:hypothetical protein